MVARELLFDSVNFGGGDFTSFQYRSGFRHLSLTQTMRQLRRESDLLTLLSEHFHLDFLGIPAISSLPASF